MDLMSYALGKKKAGSIPIEVSTVAAMTALLLAQNVGKCYKFTGTTGTYTNGDIYIVEENAGDYVFRRYKKQASPEPYPMPTKGQIITMELGGTQNTYRVLSVDGKVAFVMAMFDTASIAFSGNGENIYAGADLDTHLNTTWYNSLNSAAKTAIQATNITQYQYTYNSSSYNATTHASYANYATKVAKEVVGNRYVYALDIEDIETYFNGTFSTTDIWTLFWNTSEQPSTSAYPWLRSARTANPDMSWYVRGNYGNIVDAYVGNDGAARPAFKIDLSKITWS